MGRPKILLPFGPETMLVRVARLLGRVVEPVIVVAGAGQQLPELPGGVLVARDRRQDRGPLEGIAVGLAALGGRAEAAFVTGCDVPLLKPALVRRMIELSAGHQITLPHVGGWDEPLAAVYHTSVLPEAEALLAAGRLRPVFLLERAAARRVRADELIDVDPELESLTSLNSLADYRAALAKAGFQAPAQRRR